MTAPIIIIGSGFAAYQLIKNLRRQNTEIPIQVFTADNGDEYNKPDLSHVFTKKVSADALVKQSGTDFAKQHQVELFTNTWVEDIDTLKQCIYINNKSYEYSKLIFATGATTFIPPMQGNGIEGVITLNSLQEYRCSQTLLESASSILIMGGGLIGTELAMDLQASNKKVVIVDPNRHLLSNVTPDFIALGLENELRNSGITLEMNDHITHINQEKSSVTAITSAGKKFNIDCVISAAGLRSNTALARKIGINVNKGIMVNKQLKTSINNIYALGDYAEINGKVMAFLQPIVLSANILAKHLLGEDVELELPSMMVKIKTPAYPIQVGGFFNNQSSWQIEIDIKGIKAEAYDEYKKMTGFIVTNENLSKTFSLWQKVSSH